MVHHRSRLCVLLLLSLELHAALSFPHCSNNATCFQCQRMLQLSMRPVCNSVKWRKPFLAAHHPMFWVPEAQE